MTRCLSLIFIVMTFYGMYIGHYGGAMLSAAMAVFVIYGGKQLAKRDAEFLTRITAPDTLSLLEKQGCECSADKL